MDMCRNKIAKSIKCKSTIAIFTALSVSISACGFQPLYSTRNEQPTLGTLSPKNIASNRIEKTADIFIAPIANRKGQLLKNNLLGMLTPHGEPSNPKYKLKIVLGNFPSIKQGLQSDNTATRILINASAEYALYDIDNDKKPILQGKSRAKTSYNVLDDVYSSIVSKETAEERALKIIAEDISLRLGVYFNTNKQP
ncbi:MAG: hypothetical protein GY804_04700 [Alphaproteobacteria bacterium]|nr:hypothetical protein [Alphaproteobacteria bacterium]